jgi:ABC-type nitrate/sulfonate/bicarbonate transport system substrate-binding protein
MSNNAQTKRFVRRGKVLLAALIATSAMLLGGCDSSSKSKEGRPTLSVSYFPNSLYAAIIATQPNLLKKIPADVKFLLVQNGPAALVGIKGGSFQMTTMTGNPPITSAIALGTPDLVIYAEAYDNAALVVRNTIKSPEDMAGKLFGVVRGGSGDFEFEGWLDHNNLKEKVKLQDLTTTAMVAAFKTGAIDGAYNNAPFSDAMVGDGGHVVVTAKEIAAMGFPGINMMTVLDSYAKSHPDVVQGYVCAEVGAYKLLVGPEREDTITKAIGFLELEPTAGRKFAEDYPLFTPEEELTPKALGAAGDPSSGAVAKSLFLTGAFLKGRGSIENPPSMADITAHIDTNFAVGAAGNGCSQ